MKLYHAQATVGVYFWAPDREGAIGAADDHLRAEADVVALRVERVTEVKPPHAIDPDWDDSVPRGAAGVDARTVREIVNAMK